MYLTEVYIRAFGHLENRRFLLKPGLNMIVGENEYGKTTLAVFIQTMLFGMERGRGRQAAKDIYTRYMPVSDKGGYGGYLRFVCGERTFHLERSFIKGVGTDRLYCMDDGEEMSIEDGDLDMLLGNVSRRSFLTTSFAGQMQTQDREELLKQIKKEADTIGSKGEIDVEKAVSDLKKKIRLAQEDIRRIKERADMTIAADKSREEYIGREIDMLLRRQEEIKNLNKTLLYNETRENGKTEVSLSFFARLWRAVKRFLLRLFPKGGRDGGRSEEVTDRTRDGAGHTAARLQWETDSLERQIEAKKEQLLQLRRETQEVYRTQFYDRISELENKKSYINAAVDGIREAASVMASSVRDRFVRSVSEMFSYMTEGKYTVREIDDMGNVTVFCGGTKIETYRLSGGTLCVLFTAMRIAAAGLIHEEPLPLFFDETFAYVDDRRLERVLRVLSAEEQTLIFSCHDREKKLVEGEM